ncbi:hypothetical protein POPTR_018G119600v4 [Populus trichocarpa]|uniref:RING-type domain-containing protein n=2 Tax=Populus trichocarpa TaxID=3694 RepID=A9P889_POPTR|nr:uncharacterized protein LOC112325024 [Populus trichocarpa]ABK92592.1 unknown [Populus trichocarpa]KAI5557421.1 hypothetical protein BDE02_18G102900 [Populus trichocarpa]PNS94010.1 hypothetical protein POPTR_018G119600v4 [Populus trichocarpa]|eukprot:XP_006389423.1 uncharacterized protein LOC18111072 [Populus trichocarpa]
MGKRKRSSGDHNKNKYNSSSDDMPCSSGTELLSRQKSYLLDSSELRPLSPRVDASDGSLKLLNVHHSHAHQNYNLGRSIVLKRSRHHYGHQYSRRNSGSHADASTSRGKTALSCDERLTFKLSSHLGSEPGCHTENKELEFSRPDRVRFNSLVMDAVSSDALKIVCGICQKLVRRKPYFIGNALTAGEFSVVAILVCGHVYHSECLEQKTSLEDMRDPPCPLCSGLLSEEDAPREQE